MFSTALHMIFTAIGGTLFFLAKVKKSGGLAWGFQFFGFGFYRKRFA